MRAPSYRAFTLVEVMISLTVLAIALLGVASSIAYGTRHARSGEELTEATQIARLVLVHLQETSLLDTVDAGRPWFDAESGLLDDVGVQRDLDAAPLGGLTLAPEQLSRYRRRIVAERVSQQPGDHRYGLASVTVEILWESKAGPRRLELCGMVSHARP